MRPSYPRRAQGVGCSWSHVSVPPRQPAHLQEGGHIQEHSHIQEHDHTRNAVGIPGLEPGTSSLSAKRSNRLSYIPISLIHSGQIRQYRTCRVSPNRPLVVSETHQQSTGDTNAEVVEHRRDGTKRGTDHGVQNGHDNGKYSHLSEREARSHAEGRLSQNIA